jgi:hypothetical protein
MIRGDDILKKEILKNDNIFMDSANIKGSVAKYANITKKDNLSTIYKKYKKKYGTTKKELENPSNYYIMNEPLGPYYYDQRINHLKKIIKTRDPTVKYMYKQHHTIDEEQEHTRKNRLFNNTLFKTAKEEQENLAKNKSPQIDPAFF